MKNTFLYSIITMFVFSSFQILPNTPVAKNRILLSNSTLHEFSNQNTKDTFKLVLLGKNLLTAKATFEIIDSTGKRIYKDSFPANSLLGYETEINDLTLIKEKQIKKRVASFFANENFISPAMGSKEIMDTDYISLDKAVWDDIKKDQKRIGFYYLVGGENGRKIVYSQKIKKVIIYAACC